MPEANFSQFCSKKSFEVSYALFRIAGVVGHPSFKEHLEKQALDFLAAGTSGDFAELRKAVHTLEYFVRLGLEMNLVGVSTAQFVINEIVSFDSAIAEFVDSAKLPDVDLSGVFLTPLESPKKLDLVNKEIDLVNTKEPDDEGLVGGEGSANGDIRQSAIVDRIRQNGNCRLRDIQEVLPDLSERTIRYDLQNLVEHGIVERIGSSGPGTYYRLKSEV